MRLYPIGLQLIAMSWYVVHWVHGVHIQNKVLAC